MSGFEQDPPADTIADLKHELSELRRELRVELDHLARLLRTELTRLNTRIATLAPLSSSEEGRSFTEGAWRQARWLLVVQLLVSLGLALLIIGR